MDSCVGTTRVQSVPRYPAVVIKWAAVLVVLALVVGASTGAAAPSLAEPNPFLANYGLEALPANYSLVPRADLSQYDSVEGMAVGFSDLNMVLVESKLDPLDEVEISLHEWLHQVSFKSEYSNSYSREFNLIYEEGPVQAVTSDLLPNYWHWLTGKRLRSFNTLFYFYNPYYPDEVGIWRAASVRATGQPVRSRAAREWRANVLLIPLSDRPALLSR